jgi:hypothetical protein
MAINQIPGVGPTNADIASAVAAPSAATIASTVAASVPTIAAIQTAVTTYGNSAPSYSLQHTITTSTNNFATNAGQTFVYAVVIGGGGTAGRSEGGASGRVVFGMTPTRAVVKIGASTGTTVFGNIQAGGGNLYGYIPVGNYVVSASSFPAPGEYSRAGESGLMGGGGNNDVSGGNSTYGFNGGVRGNINGSGNTYGGGGGAGILASGANGGNASNNAPGIGGAGGAGGGGGGAGGTNNVYCGTNYGSSGAGGAGVVLVYY